MRDKKGFLWVTELLLTSLGTSLLTLVPSAIHAAIINVDTVEQCSIQNCSSDDGRAGCSFGEAIAAVNNGSDTGDCRNSSADPYGMNDTIHLPSGQILGLSLADHADPVGPTALPIITRSV